MCTTYYSAAQTLFIWLAESEIAVLLSPESLLSCQMLKADGYVDINLLSIIYNMPNAIS